MKSQVIFGLIPDRPSRPLPLPRSTPAHAHASPPAAGTTLPSGFATFAEQPKPTKVASAPTDPPTARQTQLKEEIDHG